jgi:catechol 2,3-dioxygenase-like lactoylglutathione lyase family enzyme
VADALSFYQQKLGPQGWTENPGTHEDDKTVIARFTKGGFLLDFFLGKSDRAGRVKVQIENKGNVDARQLPHLADAPEEELESFGMVHYDTETAIPAAVEFYRQELSKQGWKELKSDSRDYPDGSKGLAFIQNAMLLNVEVGPNAEGGNSVRLEPRIYGETIPHPGDPEVARGAIDVGRFPRLGGAAGAEASSAHVRYAASGTVADAARFYRKELAAKGWSERVPPPIENDDRATLRFGKKGFILEVSILTNEGKGIGISVHNCGDLNTRKLLHLEDAKLDASSLQEHTRYTTSATADAASEFYRHEMPRFGWEESKDLDASVVDLSAIKLFFVQKGMKLEIRIANAEQKTQVEVQSWVIGEPAPGNRGKTAQSHSAEKPNLVGLRPKDFPIPDDAVETKFMAGIQTVQFKTPSAIQKLMEFFRKELKHADWSEDNEQQIPVLSEIGLCIFKKGKASLTITMNRDGDMTAVTVLTHGVEWR